MCTRACRTTRRRISCGEPTCHECGLFFAVANSVPVKSMQEFLETPEAGVNLAYSTRGSANTGTWRMEVFRRETGIKMTHIPYRAAARPPPRSRGRGAGDVRLAAAAAEPTTRRARCACSRHRRASAIRAAPEIPTMRELGIPYEHDGGWFADVRARGTPPAIVDKLWREVRTAVENPEVRDRLISSAPSRSPTRPPTSRNSSRPSSGLRRAGQAPPASSPNNSGRKRVRGNFPVTPTRVSSYRKIALTLYRPKSWRRPPGWRLRVPSRSRTSSGRKPSVRRASCSHAARPEKYATATFFMRAGTPR